MDISVITAVRADTEEKVAWLREAMESVGDQDFDGDREWVVYDDDSPEALDLPREDWIVRVRGTRRQGPALGRNTCQRLARGRARVVLDADDVLASPGVLARLWEAWLADESRFVYGDIQILSDGQPGKVVPLTPDGYTFEATLNPKGVVPVTAMHSEACWRDAGGWKAELDAGLEDLEFWIAAGASGHCGLKVDGLTTILYRKHRTSRTAAMRQVYRQQEMQDRIREMHADLYEGRYPVGCCGGGRRGGAAGRPLSIPNAPRALAGERVAGGKVWVRYNGQQGAGFGIRGQATGEVYRVDGLGAEFQIWAADADFFRRQGRGRYFSVGIPEPRPPEPAPMVVPEPEPTEARFTAPEPPLAEIVRLPGQPEPQAGAIDLTDGVQPEEKDLARRAMEQARQEEQDDKLERIEAASPVDARELLEAARDHPLEDLKVAANVRGMLEDEGWTLPRLARAEPGELTPYPGIGPKTAEKLVEEARSLWAS